MNDYLNLKRFSGDRGPLSVFGVCLYIFVSKFTSFTASSTLCNEASVCSAWPGRVETLASKIYINPDTKVSFVYLTLPVGQFELAVKVPLFVLWPFLIQWGVGFWLFVNPKLELSSLKLWAWRGRPARVILRFLSSVDPVSVHYIHPPL